MISVPAESVYSLYYKVPTTSPTFHKLLIIAIHGPEALVAVDMSELSLLRTHACKTKNE